MVGDNHVEQISARNVQLEGGGRVTYHGLDGLKVDGLRAAIINHIGKGKAPSTIIVHIGMNDFFRTTSSATRFRINETLSDIRTLFPETRIIWSDILPRYFYKEEDKPGAGKRVNFSLNHFAHSMCRRIPNMRHIRHRNIKANDGSLFAWDSVYLSDKGRDLLLANWASGLEYLNANPDELGYIPSD